MLPPFIIEQIRKREEDQRRRSAYQPTLEIHIDQGPPPRSEPRDEERSDRGVIILEF
jgi:transposase InsO family protein